MRILIPTTNEDCPTVNALSREGILFEAIVMEDDYHYSRLWVDLWKKGEEFINIEHDVVPWPGAIYEVMNCDHSWCAFAYPRAPHDNITALGFIRIRSNVMRNHNDLYKYWEGVAWHQLDAAVISQLLRVGFKPHVHTPSLAHAKR